MRRGWTMKSIDELAYIGRGKSRHRPRNDPSLYGGEHPFIQTADIHSSDLTITSYSQTYSDKGLEQSKYWEPGTICITNAGENTGDCAILSIRACFPDSIIGVIADQNKSDTVFLKYAIDLLKPQLRNVTRGATQDNLSLAKLLAFKFPTPPPDSQKRIGAVLSSYGMLIENNRRRTALLETAVRHLYQEWFVRFRFPGHEHTRMHNGIPAGWRRVPLRELTSFLKRGIAPHYDDAAEGRVINQKCIRDGRLDMSLARKQSRRFSPERQVQIGDVLVNSTGEGTLGRVAQIKARLENCTVDTHVTIVRPNLGLPMHYFGMSVMAWEPQFSTMGRGATQQTELSPAAIGQSEIQIPTKALLHQFEEFATPIYQQVTNLVSQTDRLRVARDMLLPRLMTGGIAT